MYKVIKHFVDLKDNNKSYNVGDIYKGTDEKRIAELSSNKNRQKTPLIEKVEEKVEVVEEVEKTEIKDVKPKKKKK